MLQEQWASCKGIWSQSDFVIRLRQKTRQRQYGARRWMTRQELICKYSSCAIADKIIAAKQGDKEAKKTQIRSHPDIHGDDSDDSRTHMSCSVLVDMHRVYRVHITYSSVPHVFLILLTNCFPSSTWNI